MVHARLYPALPRHRRRAVPVRRSHYEPAFGSFGVDAINYSNAWSSDLTLWKEGGLFLEIFDGTGDAGFSWKL